MGSNVKIWLLLNGPWFVDHFIFNWFRIQIVKNEGQGIPINDNCSFLFDIAVPLGPFRENNNVEVFPIPFHIFMPFTNL